MAATPARKRSGWGTAVILITLALFGALEVEAVLQNDVVGQVLAGLGIVGQLIAIWLRSR